MQSFWRLKSMRWEIIKQLSSNPKLCQNSQPFIAILLDLRVSSTAWSIQNHALRASLTFTILSQHLCGARQFSNSGNPYYTYIHIFWGRTRKELNHPPHARRARGARRAPHEFHTALMLVHKTRGVFAYTHSKCARTRTHKHKNIVYYMSVCVCAIKYWPRAAATQFRGNTHI